MNPPPAKIEDALLDVRKAYRLLHDYQRMVLDAVNYIGKQLGMTYAGGWPKYSDPSPRNGGGELENWAWDWLNMVLYGFHFNRPLADGNMLQMTILLISDTGYFASKAEPKAEPTGTDFLPAEQSRTAIGFLISAKNWPDPAFMDSNAGMAAFIESGGSLPAEYANTGVVATCCSLSRLATLEETNVLIDELIALAGKSGIPLARPFMK